MTPSACVLLALTWLQAFTLALDLELQEEWTESEARLRTWSRSGRSTACALGSFCSPRSQRSHVLVRGPLPSGEHDWAAMWLCAVWL